VELEEFHRVRGQVLSLYRQGRYGEALQAALAAKESFPEKEGSVPSSMIRISSRSGSVQSSRDCWRYARTGKRRPKPRQNPIFFSFPPKRREEKFPLLIALHWFGGTAQAFAPYWEAAREQGFLLAVPQSSQVESEDGFGWTDGSEHGRNWPLIGRS
jgi:hypothetical protein